MKKELKIKQEALAQLLRGGAFQFDPAIATVSYEEYQDLLESFQPAVGYEVAYDLGGINWLERCHLDQNDQGITEIIRRERSWQYLGMRAFQLELTTVPSLILITAEPEEPKTLDNTWHCDKHGNLLAFRQTLNGHVLEDIRA